jgi:hypothetical protein
MVCAVIDRETNRVINTIVANPTDLAPYNCFLIEIPEGISVDSTGWHWNGAEFYRQNNTENEAAA